LYGKPSTERILYVEHPQPLLVPVVAEILAGLTFFTWKKFCARRKTSEMRTNRRGDKNAENLFFTVGTKIQNLKGKDNLHFFYVIAGKGPALAM